MGYPWRQHFWLLVAFFSLLASREPLQACAASVATLSKVPILFSVKVDSVLTRAELKYLDLLNTYRHERAENPTIAQPYLGTQAELTRIRRSLEQALEETKQEYARVENELGEVGPQAQAEKIRLERNLQNLKHTELRLRTEALWLEIQLTNIDQEYRGTDFVDSQHENREILKKVQRDLQTSIESLTALIKRNHVIKPFHNHWEKLLKERQNLKRELDELARISS